MTGAAVALLVALAVLVGGRSSGGTRGMARPDGMLARRGRWQWSRRPASTDVVAAVSELAALVRAGLGAASAWEHATRRLGGDEVAHRMRAASGRVQSGLSPVPALRNVAAEGSVPRRQRADLSGIRSGERSGVASADRVLAPLAATWAVHERTGAPVADLLDTLARSLRDANDAAMSRRAALAAPVATARVLAGLPVLGLLLGQVVGARPLAVLVGTGAGQVSAVVGLVCAVTGVVWTRHLLRSAAGERRARRRA